MSSVVTASFCVIFSPTEDSTPARNAGFRMSPLTEKLDLSDVSRSSVCSISLVSYIRTGSTKAVWSVSSFQRLRAWLAINNLFENSIVYGRQNVSEQRQTSPANGSGRIGELRRTSEGSTVNVYYAVPLVLHFIAEHPQHMSFPSSTPSIQDLVVLVRQLGQNA